MTRLVEKEFMIAGLRKQRDMLNELVAELKAKNDLDEGARLMYDQVTKQVEENLRKLKSLRKQYFDYQNDGLYLNHTYHHFSKSSKSKTN